MSPDTLSDVLRTVRLTGAVFFDCAATEPWVVESPARETILPKILPGADHLIAYHVVTAGRCFANIVGEEPVLLEAGEVIVFTNCDAHVLASKPGLRLDPAARDSAQPADTARLPFVVSYGNQGPDSAKFVCGYLACDGRPFNPLLAHLPPVIRAVDTKGSDTNWLSQFIRMATTESTQMRAGSESILAKLSELMFIEVVRRHLESLPPGQAGWLAGLRDRFVGKALSLMHGAPAHNWTIEELAKQVGLSRSVFAERFTGLVGVPPMHYLARWRVQAAWGPMNSGAANIATVAAQVGYGSEAAFSRAFKKMVGSPPAAWRRRVGGNAPPR
jgi:AraC-like DNA-binding protein